MHKKAESFINKTVHVLEFVIAAITVLVMVWLIGLEVYKMVTSADYVGSVNLYLQNILTIVVGLEFVRMLINLTPANTLEVLIVAISRQVIVNHDNSISNIVAVACIAGLFAIRRYLIPKNELKSELSEVPEKDAAAEEMPVLTK